MTEEKIDFETVLAMFRDVLAVRLTELIGATASARGWPTPDEAQREKLVSMAKEAAGAFVGGLDETFERMALTMLEAVMGPPPVLH